MPKSLNLNCAVDMKTYFQKKHDQGKPMWNLLDLKIVAAIVHVLTYGANKYSANSWQTVKDAEDRYKAALMRHLQAHFSGEVHDKESGLPHIWHAFCNLYFLTWFFNRRQKNRCPYLKNGKG